MPERGESLLVPFPFTDLSAIKRRPVLALTTPVPIASADLVSGALPAASWIRTNRIVTLNVSLVVKTVGRVSERTVAAAVQQVCAYIGFSGGG